ncbi:polysaccharide deacetylase family protein [Mesorhizobium sp.]|uniref:polysaccharide deacetylase family protein n=1 Tax=Mesorhizobium sp. TaxID=1871066 RepID=UPI000FE81CCE|nr:polysaccharide deacetylase family protein [Mesorhizobium sp.]RWD98801.1 MAG: polysaccharide deacetylase [Mesorhizobium sp.]
MLRRNDRLAYSPITQRPDFTWPEGKRLAVHLCLNMEHFAYNEGLGISYSPGIPHPNSYNWGWREYGNRVGVWRLIDLFDDFELPVSVLLNSAVYDHCPQVTDAFRNRGYEIVGHGRSNSEHQNDFSEDEERRLIAEATDAMTKHEGRAPKGWLSPGVNPSDVTPDLLQEAGYGYILDWPVDDQPVWMKTRAGHLLSVPYPHEINDIPFVALHHGQPDAFARAIVDNFDEMLEQSRKQSLVYGISIHTFLIGQPFRLRAFRRAIGHILAHRKDIWLTTTGAIASHYADLFPAPEH